MAQLSFRDRFFSPTVARAVTSPSGILALGVGAAVGVVVTAPFSIPAAIVGGVVGGVVGYGGRVLAALPKKGKGERIDAFAVGEPWRHAVRDAMRARNRFAEAAGSFQAGPLRDRMTTIAGRMDDAVEECWRVAKQGQVVADARRGITDREARWELQQVAAQIPPGGEASPVQARTVASLQAQLATAERLDALVRDAQARLDLLNARLDEIVSQVLELSVSSGATDLDPLGADVDGVVDDLTSLRQAMEVVGRSDPRSSSDAAADAIASLAEPPATEATGTGEAGTT